MLRNFELTKVFIKNNSICKNFYELLINGTKVEISDNEGERIKVICQNHVECPRECPILMFFKKLEIMNSKTDDFIKSAFPAYHDNNFDKNIRIKRCNISLISLCEFLFMKRQYVLIYI